MSSACYQNEVPLRTQAQLVDLLAVTINTASNSSVNTGPYYNRLIPFLIELAAIQRRKQQQCDQEKYWRCVR